jgi:WD40 repeat protein
MDNTTPKKHYDAFISYRHGGLDGLVAKRLHKLLETYRFPSSIAKKVGKKRLQRIFRDREELPTSSNLSSNIESALENSDFLLLICSPRLLESMWCMREVTTFGELHGKDRIISLLIEGEPDDSFPPGIREREIDGQIVMVEPLAADIRAATWKKSLRLLSGEKLRLLAPILGVAYDDLRQRHRRRRRQQIAGTVGAAFAFTLGFGSFSTYQYLQIAKQMQLKLENQSYVLSEYAQELLTNGDPETAMLLALEALPRNLKSPERPYVPQAQQALGDALSVYNPETGYQPYKTLTLEASTSSLAISPNETYIASACPFIVTIADPLTGEVAANLPAVDDVSLSATFLDDNTLIYTGADGLSAYDIAAGESLWTGLAGANNMSVSANKEVIAAANSTEGSASLYDRDGNLLQTISFGERTLPVSLDTAFVSFDHSLFALSADGAQLAVSFTDGSVSLFDCKDGKETQIIPPSAVSWISGGFCGDTLICSTLIEQPYYAELILYDTLNKEITASYESQGDTGAYFLPFASDEGILVAHSNNLYQVNTSTGELEGYYAVGDNITALSRQAGRTILSTESGSYYIIGEDGGVSAYDSLETCTTLAIGSSIALTGSRDSGQVRILRDNTADEEKSLLFSYDTDYFFTDTCIDREQDRILFYSYQGLRCYDQSGVLIGEASFPDPMSVLEVRHDEESGNIIVRYPDEFTLYSGSDGSRIANIVGEEGTSLLYTPFGMSVVTGTDTAVLVGWEEGEVLAAGKCMPGASAAIPIADGMLTFVGESANYNEMIPIAGGVLSFVGESVYYNESEIAEGTFCGGDRIGNDQYAFGILGNGMITVYVTEGSNVNPAFTFPIHDQNAEIYFASKDNGETYVFVSPTRGEAQVYDMEGNLLRSMSESGYLADVKVTGDGIAADYVLADGERVTYLLDENSMEAMALLPGLLGIYDDGTLLLDDGDGQLFQRRLYTREELMELAKNRLGERQLTAEEMRQYKAG